MNKTIRQYLSEDCGETNGGLRELYIYLGEELLKIKLNTPSQDITHNVHIDKDMRDYLLKKILEMLTEEMVEFEMHSLKEKKYKRC